LVQYVRKVTTYSTGTLGLSPVISENKDRKKTTRQGGKANNRSA
jgi:hypothetical protein